jgi:hypothetical protein
MNSQFDKLLKRLQYLFDPETEEVEYLARLVLNVIRDEGYMLIPMEQGNNYTDEYWKKCYGIAAKKLAKIQAIAEPETDF